tara:strand:+ start:607 stop:837 length:231 start_codon:yes stop_codon:yes gene_type:complete
MKLRKKDHWKSASEYSRDLSGLTVNLLVEDINLSIHFYKKLLRLKLFIKILILQQSKALEVGGVYTHIILMTLIRT